MTSSAGLVAVSSACLIFTIFPAVWLFVYHFVYSSNLTYGDSVYDDILHKAQFPLVTFTPREHMLLTLSRVQCIAYPFASVLRLLHG